MGIEYVYDEDTSATLVDAGQITAGSRDTDFVRSVFRCDGFSTRASWQISLPNKINDFWMNMTTQGTYENADNILTFFDNGVQFLRCRTQGSGPDFVTISVLDGSWVNLGTSDTGLLNGALNTNFCVHMCIHPTNGVVEIYIEGALSLRVTGINTIGTPLASGIDRVILDSSGTIEEVHYSEVIIANNVNIVNYRVAQVEPTGAGDDSEWLGTFAEVDELNQNDPLFIRTGEVDQTILFTGGDVPDISLVPKAISVSVRMKKDDIGPQDANIVIKTNGVKVHGDLLSLANTYTGYRQVWTDNPVTGLPFTTTEANNFQYGITSRT